MSKIVVSEDTLHGKPRVEGTRVAARTLYELYALKKLSFEKIAAQYSEVDVDDVKAAVEFMENNEDGEAALA